MESAASPIPTELPDPEEGPACGDAPALRAEHADPRLVRLVAARVLADDREYKHYGRQVRAGGQCDYIFGSGAGPARPHDMFPLLSWGGQYIFISLSRAAVKAAHALYTTPGFVIEKPPSSVRQSRLFLPFMGLRAFFFIARKVELIEPGEVTDRFTYHVQLTREPHERTFVVTKSVPTLPAMVERLRRKWPSLSGELVEKRAGKFTEKIFPTFLTREAAILQILQQRLPPEYARRVPRVIDMRQDIRGLVTSMRMNWLRNGGAPLSQMEFALQATDLLRAVHEDAGMMHLDLRLDNMVVTEHGVGFVDFGSSVQMGEDLSRNPLLSALFEELMRTSQIQRMLAKMTLSGQVTSELLRNASGKVDKAVDLFYLAVQFNAPHLNPDLKGLIHFERDSDEARALGKLTRAILAPADPRRPPFKTARDILAALERIQSALRKH